jgi:hypothetical membrane protein
MAVKRRSRPAEGRKRRQADRYAAAAGMAIGPVWIAATLVSGLVRDGYSFAAQPISDLGIGPDAWIVNASLIVTGSLAVVFALGFAHLVPAWPRRRVAAGLLATFGLGFAAAGVFHEPDPAGPLTPGGILHFVLGFFVAMVALVAALFLVASGLRREPGWSRDAAHAHTAGWLVIVLMALTQLFFNPDSPLFELGIGGLMEWALFMTWSTWFMVTGYALFRRGDQATTGPVSMPREHGGGELQRSMRRTA